LDFLDSLALSDQAERAKKKKNDSYKLSYVQGGKTFADRRENISVN
jgi:hypothetical protein